MAALTRPTLATHCINERVTIDTTDNEDHTFSGIMFPVQCKDILPVNHICINTIYVRGGLGPLTVWVSKESNNITTPATSAAAGQSQQEQSNSRRYNFRPRFLGQNNNDDDNGNNNTIAQGRLLMSKSHWTKIYEKKHKPSFREYEPLDLSDNPIILKPGQVRGVYIHSSIDNDSGIVYDNQQKIKTHDDKFITVLPGRSHVSTKPFGTRPIWGMGNAWRDYREFVGRLSYGVVYDLWNPSEHSRFGDGFRYLALILFAMQRRIESPFCRLPDECIFYILNMCRWDWADDTFNQVRGHKKKLRRRLQQANDAAAAAAAAAQASQARNDNEAAVEAAAAAADSTTNEAQAQAQATVAAASSTEEVEDVVMDSSNTSETNDDVEMQDGDEGDDEREDEYDDDEEYDEEYDEDFSEEEEDDDDDDDDEDLEFEDHGYHTRRFHERPSSFVYNVYDDCASSGEDEIRESRRLSREREERRRWMSRLHILQHWVGVDEIQFSVGDDGDSS